MQSISLLLAIWPGLFGRYESDGGRDKQVADWWSIETLNPECYFARKNTDRGQPQYRMRKDGQKRPVFILRQKPNYSSMRVNKMYTMLKSRQTNWLVMKPPSAWGMIGLGLAWVALTCASIRFKVWLSRSWRILPSTDAPQKCGFKSILNDHFSPLIDDGMWLLVSRGCPQATKQAIA